MTFAPLRLTVFGLGWIVLYFATAKWMGSLLTSDLRQLVAWVLGQQ